MSGKRSKTLLWELTGDIPRWICGRNFKYRRFFWRNLKDCFNESLKNVLGKFLKEFISQEESLKNIFGHHWRKPGATLGVILAWIYVAIPEEVYGERFESTTSTTLHISTWAVFLANIIVLTHFPAWVLFWVLSCHKRDNLLFISNVTSA